MLSVDEIKALNNKEINKKISKRGEPLSVCVVYPQCSNFKPGDYRNSIFDPQEFTVCLNFKPSSNEDWPLEYFTLSMTRCHTKWESYSYTNHKLRESNLLATKDWWKESAQRIKKAIKNKENTSEEIRDSIFNGSDLKLEFFLKLYPGFKIRNFNDKDYVTKD